MNMPTQRALEICSYTDELCEMFIAKEREYKRAKLTFDNKDKAEAVVQFLLRKERERKCAHT